MDPKGMRRATTEKICRVISFARESAVHVKTGGETRNLSDVGPPYTGTV